jgi:hypothetical protein
MIYKNESKDMKVLLFITRGICDSSKLISLVFAGIFRDTCLKKYFARPDRRFLNSNIITPGETWATQVSNFPFPFPIREPVTLRVSGIWGKILNQTLLYVFSDLLDPFFRKSLWRKTCLFVRRIGFIIFRPYWPYCRRLEV